jgi:hypothetical protein
MDDVLPTVELHRRTPVPRTACDGVTLVLLRVPCPCVERELLESAHETVAGAAEDVTVVLSVRHVRTGFSGGCELCMDGGFVDI